MNYILVVLYLLLSAFGMVLIKLGGSNTKINYLNRTFGIHIDLWLVGGVLFYLMSFFLWIIILQKFKLSYISPLVSGISYILIITLSLVILNEKISSFQWIGIGIIFIGVIFMNIK
ncbi:EamA family transporter [Paenibacillus sp. FSL R5-0912]|uniref:EamA family transporter n=1 Tax=Paenibacillus sp. FSL R5-0912 TaxID=1536771 RepID=UPI0004F81420|nr:EamA family transporter [Paenibacillus sp. FSL R5-0912]AIQ43943.1 hypothetical protein R50912_31100 [Paenibacillus sp. FSL R5-0912]